MQRAGSPFAVLYMREHNAKSPKHDRKRFNSIVKRINFSYLPIIYLCLASSPSHNIAKFPMKLISSVIEYGLTGSLTGYENLGLKLRPQGRDCGSCYMGVS